MIAELCGRLQTFKNITIFNILDLQWFDPGCANLKNFVTSVLPRIAAR